MPLLERGIAIVSTSGDPHALYIGAKIHERGVRCHLFETDLLASRANTFAQFDSAGTQFSALDSFGERTDVSGLRVSWWRRIAKEQRKDNLCAQADRTVLSNDCVRYLFIGGFLAAFTGTFISSPQATMLVENKLLQLRVAAQVGLRVPQTIISSDVASITSFAERFGGVVVGKSLVPFGNRMVDAIKIKANAIDFEDILGVPTIFQEPIEGSEHIRAIIFGATVLLVRFDSQDLDWRRKVPNRMSLLQGEHEIRRQLLMLCELLDLKMGVADLKIDRFGDIVFFEINPQGQFLFVEPYINVSIADMFADFLVQSSATVA